MKIWINETVGTEDKGEGGVGRVVRAQREWFPRLGHEVVDDPAEADVLACHIFADEKVLARHPEKALVAHIHGLYWAEYEWDPWAHKANRNVLDAIGAADLTTVPTHWVANAVRRHTSRETIVIPHGVDLDEWSPKDRDAKVPDYILWDKNRPDPVCDPAPMNELARRMPAVNFVSTFGHAAGNVTLTDRLPYVQARELMLGATVYLATTRETFGISTLQAMAAGVPTAGWDWGGQAEFLGPGGILVTPEDYDALAEAVRTLMGERETYAQAARQRAEALGDWKPLMEAYIQSYRRAIELAERTGPRVSIIVPAYGLDQYLPAALDSVLEQVETDWECIVVDDASPDRCGAIADEYAAKDDRFRVIHNETNQYLAGARNTGIAAARGRYILPLDADDMLPTRAVQTLANALDADRTLHVAYGRVRFVDQDGTTPTVYPGWEREPGHSGWPMEFTFEWQAYERNLLPYSSMFRRRAWEQTGGYRTRCRTAEDADFWLRLSSYGFRPAMVTTADTLVYRNREDSMSRQEGQVEWSRWFPWGSRHRRRPPAGWLAGLSNGTAQADSAGHSDVPSLDPSAVAVIIPVGPGHEAIVRDAIDSVEAQTWEQWECIVVNDSGNPLGPLPQWVTVLETAEPSSGVAIARNVGIDACRSTWFLPLDADDLLEPTALETWMGVAVQHPEDVIYSDFYEDPQVEGEFKIYESPDYEP
ncbi:MAG: glycosyltransferase, partial [Gemmatimonadales bacterium]